MIPERREADSTEAERIAEWQARCLVTTILDAAAGMERKGIGSLAVIWDVTVMMLAVLRGEAAKRDVPWEHVEDALNRDAADWHRDLFPEESPEGAD